MTGCPAFRAGMPAVALGTAIFAPEFGRIQDLTNTIEGGSR
jgi:hypothetical protein